MNCIYYPHCAVNIGVEYLINETVNSGCQSGFKRVVNLGWKCCKNKNTIVLRIRYSTELKVLPINVIVSHGLWHWSRPWYRYIAPPLKSNLLPTALEPVGLVTLRHRDRDKIAECLVPFYWNVNMSILQWVRLSNRDLSAMEWKTIKLDLIYDKFLTCLST